MTDPSYKLSFRCRFWTEEIEKAENEDNVIELEPMHFKAKPELVEDWARLRSEIQGAGRLGKIVLGLIERMAGWRNRWLRRS